MANKTISRLKELNEIGIALSKQHDINCLLELILDAAKRITHADAGTLYLLDAEQRAMRFEIVRTDSLHIAMGGINGEAITYYPVQLYDQSGNENHAMVVSHAALSGETVNIADAYTAQDYDFTGTKNFDAKTGYRSQSFLTVPMRNHEDVVIGVLQLINAQDPHSGAVLPFSHEDQQALESLASQAAIALTNRRLIKQLEELFESFIGLINSAIDDKSPYTGGHCARVPELTMMLAEAVTNTRQGPLKDFVMTEKDRHELRIASLLHDCGKITTPVHVVDKPTKLHTLFDRIELLDTRFEVLKRDAEIAMLRALAAVPGKGEGGVDDEAPSSCKGESGVDDEAPSSCMGESGVEDATPSSCKGEGGVDDETPSSCKGESGVDDATPSSCKGESGVDDATPSSCKGEGGGGGDVEAAIHAEFAARIRQLDDDRDFLRHCNIGSEVMQESARQRIRDIASCRWGDVGQHALLSEDEVENLTIRSGTLTTAERGIINHHIDVTIKMLESLPWPKHLKNVPEYAGGHHERVDGKGYPRGLTRDQMSVQARTMAIADIFEALTAKDRPYKVGKTLTEALTILGKFKLGGHIDPDLFDVFIREKVYLDYAEKFLPIEQRDEVDLSKIPGVPAENGI